MIDFGWWQILVAEFGIFLIAFLKGAFGGGFALIGIPLLSLAMDPISAATIIAPLFLPMDVIALRYWKPSTWSKPDLVMLVPSLILGIALGTVLIAVLNTNFVAIVMALTTLAFTAIWVSGGQKNEERPRSWPLAVLAGTASGITSMIAHSGGPPLAMYLLRLGLRKDLYAGTTNIYFTVANWVKIVPWLMIGKPGAEHWLLMLLCLPAAVGGVWVGWKYHNRLDQAQMYRWCYVLLVLTSLKLLWDGITGLM